MNRLNVCLIIYATLVAIMYISIIVGMVTKSDYAFYYAGFMTGGALIFLLIIGYEMFWGDYSKIGDYDPENRR